MAKIAALILPRGQSDRLEKLARTAGEMLGLGGGEAAVVHHFTGKETVGALIRVGSDPFTRGAAVPGSATIMCGYYSSDPGSLGERGSLAQLSADLDAGGPDALCGGDGVYAYVRWTGQDQLLAGVDKLGLRPLYWTRLPAGGHAIASEIKALVPLLSQSDVNWAAWEEQLILGFNLENHTLIQGIHRFGPGQTMRADGRSAEIRMVEDFIAEMAAIEPTSPELAMEENQQAFLRSMGLARHLAPAAPRLLTLSGGFDSRRILAAMLHEGEALTAYTVPDIKPDGVEFESALVRDLCEHVGIPAYRVCPPSVEMIPDVLRIRDLMVDFESDEHGYATVLAMALRSPDGLNFDGFIGDVVVNGVRLAIEHCAPSGGDLFRDQVLASVSAPWCRFPVTGPPLAERLDHHLRSLPGGPMRQTLYNVISRLRREIILAPITIQGDSFESYFPYTDREVIRSGLRIPARVRAGHEIQWKLAGLLDQQVCSVPSAYDPSVPGNPRFRSENPHWALRNRRSSLTDALRGMKQPSVRPFVPFAQRLRLHALRALLPLLSSNQLVWQVKKLEFLDRFSRFMEQAASPDRYRRAMEPLRGVAGRNPEWITPIAAASASDGCRIGLPNAE